MKPAEYYEGREQTYLKHFFLERYLERLAFKIGSFADDFVYVDGFAGPWRADGTEYEDTSFKIALSTLRKAREGLSVVGKRPRIRCVFVEKKKKSFARLRKIVANEEGLDEVIAVHGELEDCTADVLKFVGRSFALFFVDPTGWKGVGVNQLSPILRHRPGEVIVNFMFDYINRRFLTDPHLDELYGMTQARRRLDALGWDERGMVSLYRDQLKAAGAFEYATFTRIKKPTADRTYFYLVYGTRHANGVKTFREVEKKFVTEQEAVRQAAKQASRVQRTGQTEMFSPQLPGDASTFDTEREIGLKLAEAQMIERVEKRIEVNCGDLVPALLEIPLVWESDLGQIARRLETAGRLDVVGMSSRQRLLRNDVILRLKRRGGA